MQEPMASLRSALHPPGNSVTVVGATCPLGKHLVERLLQAGCPVLALYRTPAKVPSGWKEHPAFQGKTFDITDPSTLPATLGAGERIVWLAHSREHQKAAVDANAIALETVCAQPLPGGRKIVLLSSGGTVYGNPISLPVSEDHPRRPLSDYGQSKLKQEETLSRAVEQSPGLSGIILRCGNIYGEHYLDSNTWGCISAFTRSVLASEPVPLVAGGAAVRDFVHVDDTVRAIMAALACHQRFTAWNVASGLGTKILHVLKMIGEILGRPVARVEAIEAPTTDVKEIFLDIRKIEREGHWRPRIELRQGLEAMLTPLRRAAGSPAMR
jgi:UDP-glucose 4-epimerase